MFRRPLHRFVAKTVGVTFLAGVCFHFAMDSVTASRAPRPVAAREEPCFLAEEGTKREREGSAGAQNSGVANQNEAFRRFLVNLEGKDAQTKIEDAVQGMEYFMRPTALDADVRLKRVQRPTDPSTPSPARSVSSSSAPSAPP
ncbi:hypothetical protein NSK_005581 [Nannochloropsis salina CCMP1776]|uniref:Uncharacterized protein n=1 Tax=Nannochloropsis salina CCMP1776 TaxID=1027361 RepID=A0A4D9CV29_9STRA|nr:hypothetical protein NSK_005581 [Nannochloropsis salina CCMP1776]|eukprot:TFJ83112.1 hypothetical protein NSK_005581 [Nannochloropsis salina CCMP1776]